MSKNTKGTQNPTPAEPEPRKISRSEFIQTVAAVGAGVSAGCMLGGATSLWSEIIGEVAGNPNRYLRKNLKNSSTDKTSETMAHQHAANIDESQLSPASKKVIATDSEAFGKSIYEGGVAGAIGVGVLAAKICHRESAEQEKNATIQSKSLSQAENTPKSNSR